MSIDCLICGNPTSTLYRPYCSLTCIESVVFCTYCKDPINEKSTLNPFGTFCNNICYNDFCRVYAKELLAEDTINHPKHYNSGPTCQCGKNIECITITRNMNFNLGNVMKYIWRHDHKNGLEDLKKAQWYLNDEIKRREAESDK